MIFKDLNIVVRSCLSVTHMELRNYIYDLISLAIFCVSCGKQSHPSKIWNEICMQQEMKKINSTYLSLFC